MESYVQNPWTLKDELMHDETIDKLYGLSADSTSLLFNFARWGNHDDLVALLHEWVVYLGFTDLDDGKANECVFVQNGNEVDVILLGSTTLTSATVHNANGTTICFGYISLPQLIATMNKLNTP